MTTTSSDKTILVVDDDSDIVYLLGLTLSDAGYQVQQETSAAALEARLLSDEPLPDLLLLDIKLGDQDAVALVKRLRARARTRRLPVLLMSARSDVVEAAQMCGARGLAKPFSMGTLREAVAQALAP